jgi:hypothetical protein
LINNQNVNINDSQKHTADYKRTSIETVQGTDTTNVIISFLRRCLITVASNSMLSRLPVFSRLVLDQTIISDGLKPSRDMSRKFEETLTVDDISTRSQGFYRGVSDSLRGTDIVSYPVLFVRTVHETQGITDTMQKWGSYIRGLFVEAGSIAETVRWGDFFRKESETVHVDGYVFRHLMVFIKLLSTSLVRDFIIRRFLIAREELVLKSSITRDLILESKIN